MAAPRPDTVLEVLRAAEGYLGGLGIDAPRRSVELLMARVLGLSRLQLYLAHDRPLDEGEKTRLRALVARRGRGEPVAYLLGDWEFYGHELAVGPAVLVPRPETEGLVARVLESAPRGGRIVDLGTGSGAIAIAIALERDDLEVWATDVSAAALEVAKANVDRHGLEERVHLVHGSWWSALAGDVPEAFDVVVSNPPYVDRNRPDLLDPHVAAHEPDLALFPDGEPTAAYAAILAGFDAHTRPGSRLFVETGVDVATATRDLIAAHSGLVDVVLEDDLAGLPRYVRARRSET